MLKVIFDLRCIEESFRLILVNSLWFLKVQIKIFYMEMFWLVVLCIVYGLCIVIIF